MIVTLDHKLILHQTCLVKSDKVVLLHTLLSFLDSIHISKLVIQEQQQHLSDYQK